MTGTLRMPAATYCSRGKKGTFQLLGWQREGGGEDIMKEGTLDLGLQVPGSERLK